MENPQAQTPGSISETTAPSPQAGPSWLLTSVLVTLAFLGGGASVYSYFLFSQSPIDEDVREDFAKDYRIIRICENVLGTFVSYAEKATVSGDTRNYERKILLSDAAGAVNASFDISQGLSLLAGGVDCESRANNEIMVSVTRGEIEMYDSEYIFINPISRSFVGKLNLFSDNNGAWLAKRSMRAENAEHRYRLLDEPAEQSRRILIIEEQMGASSCTSISACISAPTTIRVLKDEVIPAESTSLDSLWSFKFTNINSESVEISVVDSSNNVLLSQKLEM